MTAQDPGGAGSGGGTTGPPRGIVFACSGATYLPLAVHAARSAAATNPGLPIDLYCDRPCGDAVFDRVHALDRVWFRPKFEAIRRSRFDRTLYLDTDVRVLADISDVFDLLDRFDIAGAHDAYRNSRKGRGSGRVPVSFPQMNSGVLAVRRSDATADLMRAVEADLLSTGNRKDQPLLRERLWSSRLSIGILPEEYNLMAYRNASLWTDRHAAPRIVHNPALTRLGAAPLSALTGERLARHIAALLAADRSLDPTAPQRRVLAMAARTPSGALAAVGDKLRRIIVERIWR